MIEFKSFVDTDEQVHIEINGRPAGSIYKLWGQDIYGVVLNVYFHWTHVEISKTGPKSMDEAKEYVTQTVEMLTKLNGEPINS